jgi:hypothetical protein
MAGLSELIGTPRAAKRFVNVYRLLKASTRPTRIGAFRDPGTHRPVLLLLAILTGHPAEATAILRALLDGTPTGTWLAFIRAMDEPTSLLAPAPRPKGRRSTTSPLELVPRADLADADERRAAERWAQLLAKLGRLEPAVGPLDAISFRPWALPVARYGFEASRILAGEEPAEATAAASPDHAGAPAAS